MRSNVSHVSKLAGLSQQRAYFMTTCHSSITSYRW